MVQDVRQRTHAPYLWLRRSMPSFYIRYKRGRPLSLLNTPISRVAFVTTRRNGARLPRKWPPQNATICGSPPPSEQALESHPPPAPRRAQRPRLPPSPSLPPLHQRVPPPLQLPRRLGTLCPRRRHRPPACRSPPLPRGQLLLRAAPDSLHQPPATTVIWTFAFPGSCI